MKKLSAFFFRRNQKNIEDQFATVLTRGREVGLWDEASVEMIENIRSFSNILVREIMVPRTQIVAVNRNANPQDILAEAIESRHTRIPVYRDTIDNITGILNVKDLLRLIPGPATQTNLFSHLSKPYYIPETKSAHLLFQEFRQYKKQIAIVIDEYGGTSGLVTLEDLLEEIVGEIRDEHETGEEIDTILETADGAYLCDGRAEIEKVEETLGITLLPGRYETIGGLVLSAARRIPTAGEKFQIEGLEITVEQADERTIKRIRLKKTGQADTHEK